MNAPKRIAVMFGGKSAEHQISLISARNIVANLPRETYEPILIAIDAEQGSFWTAESYTDLVKPGPQGAATLDLNKAQRLIIRPGADQPFCLDTSDRTPLHLDAVFPILHGPMGEDGSMQGLLRILGLPFVGPDLAASAIGMDKALMKRILEHSGIANAPWRFVRSHEIDTLDVDDVVAALGLPLFIKPANMGSSIGIRRVEQAPDLPAALRNAARYDTRIIIESAIQGREIECAVMGNQNLKASPIGEIKPLENGWYSWDAKYFHTAQAELLIPADLDATTAARVQQTALQCYAALGLEGLSRVDMFLTTTGEIYVNEVNTLPGFTPISMYPKLWEHAGLMIEDLLDQLIQLAFDRHAQRGLLIDKPDMAE
ncbi:MAG: D-alanine--D-alanine ligase [Leptospiraceae bacterium]|nr:D-alanine--D-alanine ligase [Leptospiraceae bacterium]